MRTILILLALLASPALASQTVWKWVDAGGVTHYSDTPVEGAVKVELNTGGGNRWDSSAPRGPSGPSQPTASVAKVSPNYQIEIWRPANEETFPNPSEAVDVRLRIDPALQAGDSLYLYLDGRLVEGYSPTATDFSLKDLERGAHSVMAIVNDSRGQQVGQAKTVQFFMRQPSVNDLTRQPAVGPPKPTPPKRK
jgi:hypothetical protein